MKIRDIMVEGPIDSIKKAMNTPTGQGVKAGLTKAFGGTTGDFSRSSKSSVLQGINTDMLRSGLTRIVSGQAAQQDEIGELKKLLAKLS
jgi:hypothetical protein